MIDAGIAHLTKRDKALGRLIRKIGPLRFEPAKRRTPFAALTQAVIGQQLSAAAARSIHKRLTGMLPSGTALKPAEILALPDDSLRSAGLSRAKIATVKDIAKRATEGVLPSKSQIVKMSDEEIVEALIEIKGVGRWTIEMFLIFTLGRPDVFPADDFTVRKGFAVVHGLKDLPKPKHLLAHAEAWRPHRTTAALYLYRVVDLDV